MVNARMYLGNLVEAFTVSRVGKSCLAGARRTTACFDKSDWHRIKQVKLA